MRWIKGLLIILLLSGANFALAASYEVRPGVEVNFSPPPSHWQISKEPPDFLIEEHTGHLGPEQLDAARQAGLNTAEDAVRRMLSGNDLYLYNPQNGAHLIIDFSPLREGEVAPRARTLKTSARYAAEGLGDEEGFEAVNSRVGKTRIAGARHAYRIDADFLKHGEPTSFIGIVTFALDHWVYLYYTGPQSAVVDSKVINEVLGSFRIASKH